MSVSRDPAVLAAYARDVSGLELTPEAVARPSSAAEVAELVRQAAADGMSITAAGAQTSTTGASITDRGVLVSLRAMDRVVEIDPERRVARVQPGVIVGALKREVAAHGLLFAPDPTSEDDATVGGAIACNASGARSLRYGATRPHVLAVTVVTADGRITEFRRPSLEKNTVGFAAVHDPVDWFVGSEGTLGVVVEAELALVPLPPRTVGLAVPFATEAGALAFVADARDRAVGPSITYRAQCLEYFDGAALAIARDAGGDPSWAAGAGALVYLEEAPDDPSGSDDALDAALDRWLALAEAHGALDGDIRVYDGESALREARRLRHSVPAYMNERGAARRAHGGRKVSTDWAVPYRRLGEAIEHARRLADVAGVEQAVIYGHAGNGHPHQNFIARDADELRRIEGVVADTVRHVLSMGGTVSAEHGLGKLKRHWLPVQLSAPQLAAMRALKQALDPAGLFAPGNVL